MKSAERSFVHSPLTFLFPYMGRWHAVNRSRYSHLLTAIADQGHRVIVVQPPARDSAETNFIDLPVDRHPNIEVLTVAVPRWLWHRTTPWEKFVKKALFTISSIPLIQRRMRSGTADVLLLYNLPQYVYTFRCSLPIVFDLADDYVAMFMHELGISRKHVLTKLSEFVLNRLVSSAALVTAVSEKLRQSITHQRSLLLPNGAPMPPQPEVEHVPRRRGPRPTLGYVGAFEYFIDLDLMLAVAERMSDCSFLLVGAGREYPRVRSEIERRNLHNIELPGPLPHSEAMRAIDRIDICLNLFVKSPVSHAASPIKLFEYLVKAKPVISTRLEEVLRLDPEGSILYYADTVDEVVAAARSVLSAGPELTVRLRRGEALVRQGYTWERLAGRFVDACREVVACDRAKARRETHSALVQGGRDGTD